MSQNFENRAWKLQLLGDHAIVFSLEQKMEEAIMQKIIALLILSNAKNMKSMMLHIILKHINTLLLSNY